MWVAAVVRSCKPVMAQGLNISIELGTTRLSAIKSSVPTATGSNATRTGRPGERISISDRRDESGKRGDSHPMSRRNPILFCGKPINLTAIAFLTSLSLAYISLIFSGQRQPSIRTAKKIANALGMGFQEFVDALEEHVSVRKIAALLEQE
jgi:transcriptional regulator with XRE-family HTH domain